MNNKVLDMIPNIKKLGITYDHTNDAVLSHGYGDLARCHKLEKLVLLGTEWEGMKNIKFPSSLMKLVLSSSVFPKGGCRIGSLPNLQLLKSTFSDFEDNKWNTVEGEFQSLEILSIGWCNLQTWTTEDCCHFPSLQRLSLEDLYELEEIPEIFGESMTLESIELLNCSISACISAKKILDQQQSQGNYDLTVKVIHEFVYAYDNDEEMMTDLQSMANDNFHVTIRE